MAIKTQISGVKGVTGLNKYIHLAFLVLFFLLYYVLSHLIETIWYNWAAPNDTVIIIITIIIAGGITIYLWLNPAVNAIAKEIANELSKVTWPNKKETYAFTITVIITSIISALILGFFDMILAWLTGLIY